MTNREQRGATGQQAGEAVVDAEALVREYTRGRERRFFGEELPVVRALDGVSVAVHRGEVLGVVGPSGSGKSTLLYLLAGLDTPTSGRVALAGTDVGDLSARARARHRLEHVGLVFQRFHLLPALSARANVALPLVELGWSRTRRRERATELLSRVGLGDRVDHRPGQLSGGEQQRVAIARALAAEPDVLVADEPTGELDSATTERVLDVFRRVAEDRAVILASHDEAARAAMDRVVELRDGRRLDGQGDGRQADEQRADELRVDGQHVDEQRGDERGGDRSDDGRASDGRKGDGREGEPDRSERR